MVYHEDVQTANLLKQPTLGQEPLRCGRCGVPLHPHLILTSSSPHPHVQAACAGRGRRAPSCVHHLAVLWLWRPGQERLIGSLASLPGRRTEPAQRPQRGQESRIENGSGRAVGERLRWLPRRTEQLSPLTRGRVKSTCRCCNLDDSWSCSAMSHRIVQHLIATLPQTR